MITNNHTTLSICPNNTTKNNPEQITEISKYLEQFKNNDRIKNIDTVKKNPLKANHNPITKHILTSYKLGEHTTHEVSKSIYKRC